MFLAIFKETAKKIARNKKNRLMLILSVINISFLVNEPLIRKK